MSREITIRDLALALDESTPLGDRINHLGHLIRALRNEQMELIQQRDRLLAQMTLDQRLQPSHPAYLTHLTHCYGEDHEPGDGSMFGCKYGEDNICPAAMFQDPIAECLRIMALEEAHEGQ